MIEKEMRSSMKLFITWHRIVVFSGRATWWAKTIF